MKKDVINMQITCMKETLGEEKQRKIIIIKKKKLVFLGVVAYNGWDVWVFWT